MKQIIERVIENDEADRQYECIIYNSRLFRWKAYITEITSKSQLVPVITVKAFTLRGLTRKIRKIIWS